MSTPVYFHQLAPLRRRARPIKHSEQGYRTKLGVVYINTKMSYSLTLGPSLLRGPILTIANNQDNTSLTTLTMGAIHINIKTYSYIVYSVWWSGRGRKRLASCTYMYRLAVRSGSDEHYIYCRGHTCNTKYNHTSHS